jgi:GAF domain-containing protein
MTATLEHQVADLRRANAELQKRLDERTAELSEAQAQKAALAEVLEVINASPGNLAPVFDEMVKKALSLCDAAFGGLFTYDGEFYRTAAHRNIPSELIGAISLPLPAQSVGGVLQAIANGENLIHLADIVDTEDYRSGVWSRRVLADLGGARTALWVALRKDDALLGVLVLYRTEVRPFSQKQVALFQHFAAQAVIAMENARLITETREALEQQTATAEVLQVINSSPGDLVPVFDAVLEKATRLCDAAFGVLFTVDGEELRAAAMRNMPEGLVAPLKTIMRVHQLPVVASVVQSRRVLHIHDFAASDAYRNDVGISTAAVEAGGVRSVLYVPLVKDDRAIGVFVIFRQEVRPFTDKQMALVQNFAAQAVIAMENARLLTETREALAQQTATAEVLGVINSSPGVPAPVFDAMLEKALHLCEAAFGLLATYDSSSPKAMRATEFFNMG